MKNLEPRDKFLAENKTEEFNPVNEKSMSVHVDAKDTKATEEAIKKTGAKVTKATDFGIIEIETDPKLVDEIKGIEDVTAVEEIKKK